MAEDAGAKARLLCARSLSDGRCSIAEEDFRQLGFPPSLLPLYQHEQGGEENPDEQASRSSMKFTPYIGGLDRHALDFFMLVLAIAREGAVGGITHAASVVGGVCVAGGFFLLSLFSNWSFLFPGP
jgi:hypothetical protein